jgi:hypothetical protein
VSMFVPDRMWSFTADMNFDGLLTISDIFLWAQWLAFYPGDWLISKMIGTKLGVFLELSSLDYGGVFSGIVAVVIFIFLLVVVD